MENLELNPRPFTLSILEGRFAPVLTDTNELRKRGGSRVQVGTTAGLRVGLAKGVFARKPLLPSDIEAEEREQVNLTSMLRTQSGTFKVVVRSYV